MGKRQFTTRLGATLALLIPALGVSAAHAERPGTPAHAGGSITVALSYDSTSLDPAQTSGVPDDSIASGALFSGLYRINVHGKLSSDIADGMPTVSSDQKVFTIKLKHGVMFNGVGFTPREVTAQDVVYTLERTLNPHLKPTVSYYQGNDIGILGADAYVGGKAAHVQGIAALDRYTVRITMANALTSLPYVLSFLGNFIVPKEVADKYGANFGLHPVGSGPFMLKQWVKGQKMVLTRNPLYFVKGLPYLDQITFEFNVGKDLEVLRWQQGQVDAIGDSWDLPPNEAQDLATDPSVQKYLEPIQPSPQTNVIYINNSIAPFNNKLMRMAVAYAVNKKRLVRLFHQQIVPAAQIYPPAVTQYQPGFQGYSYDPQKAAALLKQAGYTGQPVEVLIDTGSSNDPVEGPSVIQDLKAAGFNIKARSVSDQQWNSLVGQPKGYTMIFGYWGMDYPDAYDFVVPTYTKDGLNGLNFSRYLNPLIDTMVNQAEALPFGTARDAVYGKIQRTLVDDVAAVPLFYRLRFYLNGPRVASLGWSPAYSYNEWAYARTR